MQLHSLKILQLSNATALLYRFFLVAFRSFLFLTIRLYKASSPSWSPSPVIAQAGWMCHPLNATLAMLLVDKFDDEDDGIEDWGDVLLVHCDWDESNVVHDIELDIEGYSAFNSCRPRSFSSSLESLAPGKSCLLANINTGTPWLSGALAVLISSILASSIRSTSTESNTKTMPSVHLV